MLGADHRDTIRASLGLARDLYILSDTRAGLLRAEHTRRRCHEALGTDAPLTRSADADVALGLLGAGEIAKARTLFERVLAWRRRVLGADHPSTLAVMGSLASVLRSSDVWAARDLDTDVQDWWRRLVGDDHHRTMRATLNLAVDARLLNDFRLALELGQRVLAWRRQAFGAGHPTTLAAEVEVARCLSADEYPLEARRRLRDILTRYREMLGADHPDALMVAELLAIALIKTAEVPAGLELLTSDANEREAAGLGHSELMALHEQLGVLGGPMTGWRTIQPQTRTTMR